MRNLKRALSLVMAAAMLIGMMAVSASAADTYEDFTDKDEIQNTEAVQTLVSLGVIAGKEDGSYFDPTGIVTRAEMAKLIAVSLNGGKDLVIGSGASTTQFSDTKGNWAEAYIAYCANLGIINGKGDGTFGPNEPVTGTAAAKMFLCALGYRSDIEKLTGAGWDLNTDTLAMKAGLYEGLDHIVPSDGLTRDNTAQLVYNGVQAQEVEYKNNYGEYSGVIYAQPIGSMLANRFGVVKVTGVARANSVLAIDGSGTTVSGKSRLDLRGVTGVDSADLRNVGSTFPVEIPTSMLGQEVVLYVKFQNSLSPNATNSTVLGNPIISEANTTVVTTGKMDTAAKVKDALKGSGISVPSGGANGVTLTDTAVSLGSVNGQQTKPGVTQTFIDNNNDGTVDYIIRENPTLTKVTVYNTKDEKLSLEGIGSVDFSEVIGYEDVEKNDYVLVLRYTDDVFSVVKAESVEGEVTAYNTGNKKITVDGTAYGEGSGANKASELTAASSIDQTLIGNSYKLYMDPNGNVLAYEMIEETVGNLAVVLASGADSDMMGGASGKVKLLLPDGTKTTYEVNLLASAKKFDVTHTGATTDSAKEFWMATALKVDLATANTDSTALTKVGLDGATASTGLTGTIVSYSLSDDNVVTIGEPNKFNSRYDYAAAGITASQELISTKSSYAFGAQTLVADGTTLFYIHDSNQKWSVVTGLKSLSSNGKDITSAKAVYYQGPNSSTLVAKAIYVELSEAYTTSSNYVYISAAPTQITEKGNDVFEYPVVFEDGTTGTVKEKTTATAVKETVREYTTDNDGYVTFGNTNVVNGQAVTYVGNGSYGFADVADLSSNFASYPLASDAKIWNVEDTDDIYDTSLSMNSRAALVLKDGAIKTAFVIEVLDTVVVEPTAIDISVADVGAGADTIAVSDPDLLTNGDSVVITDAVATDTVTVTVTPVAGTSATVAIEGAGTDIGPAANTATYALDAGDLDGSITVTVVVSQAGRTSRTYTYTIDVAAVAGP